ncbi:hypothetical protein BKA61DRAFT_515910 [Leptodontidium sp. MPI-SDFR-AT-0119]|nr:hypothetical protein BKA61DRAFT_515910 [Leptodontidium sp. MPI-SDFR-AT-0119]
MLSNSAFTIVVVGGGVAGLSAAIGLRLKGHKIIVLEKTTTLQTLGGSLLIPPNAARVLHSYGIYDKKFRASEAMPGAITTFRYDDGRVLEEIDYRAMEGIFGFPAMSIPRATYQKLLYDAAIDLGVQVHLSSRIKHLDENTPSVTLTTGEVITGDIIVGADGIKSAVRSAILGDDDVQPVPESIAYQTSVSEADMMSDPLTAPLMSGNTVQSWYGPSRQIISGSDTSATYRSTLIVYPTTTLASASDVVAANSTSSYRLGSVTSLRQVVSDFEPRVRKMAELVKPEDCFLWKIAHLPTLKSWVSESGRVVLIGDAAHAMVPHFGAGAATAVEDGGVLAACIDHAHSLSSIPDALKAYEKLRRPRSERVQAAALTTGQYKVMPDGPAQQDRDLRMAQRMDKSNPRYKFWKAAGGVEWFYGYKFEKEVNEFYDSASKNEQQTRIGSKL